MTDCLFVGIVSGAGNAVAISVDIVVAVAQDDAAACSSSAIYISWSPWFALPARSRQAEPAPPTLTLPDAPTTSL